MTLMELSPKLTTYLVSYYAVMKHHDQKASWGGKGLLGLHFSIAVHQWRKKSGQELSRAGSWRQELMQRPRRGAAYWFASHGLLSSPFYRTQDQQPTDGNTHHELGPPLLITKWENALQLDLMEACPLLRFVPLMTLVCVKLTHKTSQYTWDTE